MTAAAYQAAFELLFLLSSENAEPGARPGDLGWALVEVQLDTAACATVTDLHALQSLHEDLLTGDPTGREGRDLFT
jgi:hypothetical protein